MRAPHAARRRHVFGVRERGRRMGTVRAGHRRPPHAPEADKRRQIALGACHAQGQAGRHTRLHRAARRRTTQPYCYCGGRRSFPTTDPALRAAPRRSASETPGCAGSDATLRAARSVAASGCEGGAFDRPAEGHAAACPEAATRPLRDCRECRPAPPARRKPCRAGRPPAREAARGRAGSRPSAIVAGRQGRNAPLSASRVKGRALASPCKISTLGSPDPAGACTVTLPPRGRRRGLGPRPAGGPPRRPLARGAPRARPSTGRLRCPAAGADCRPQSPACSLRRLPSASGLRRRPSRRRRRRSAPPSPPLSRPTPRP